MAETIRIGVIGAGSFGTERARAFSEVDDCRVTMGWSRSAEKREVFAERFGCRCVEEWEELARSDEVDAVVVATCHSLHYGQAHAALSAGKHALVETPLALSHEDGKSLAELAKEKGVILHHGAKWRYHPDHHVDLDNLKLVGNLLWGSRLATFDYGAHRGWYGARMLSEGPFALVPYQILIYLEAFGPFRWAKGWEETRGALELATITIGFEGGGTMTVGYGTGLGIPEANEQVILGTKGTIVSPTGGPGVFSGSRRRIDLPTKRELDVVFTECRAFAEEIRGERDHEAHLARDLESLRALDEARRDAGRGGDHGG